MRIRVKLFAILSSPQNGVAPGAPFEMEVPDGATLANLVNQLKLPLKEVKMAFVNGQARAMDWPLQPGDEVGFFPPLGGG